MSKKSDIISQCEDVEIILQVEVMTYSLTHSLTRHSDSQIIWRILTFHLNTCQIVSVNTREIPRRNVKSG